MTQTAISCTFASSRRRKRHGRWSALALLAGLWLHGAAFAAGPLDAWRADLARTRTLAENDAPGAHAQALRLQAALPADATPADQARVLNLLSRTEVYLALTEPAAAHAERAFDLAQKHGDKIGQAEADLNVALNAVNQGRIDALIAATTRSVSELDGVNRPDLLGEALLRTSMMYRRVGQFDESVTLAMQAMEIARRGNDPLALTYAHQGLAISFDQSFRYTEARDHYLKMRDLARAAHSKQLEAYALLGVGGLATILGDAAAGERTVRDAIALFDQLGAPFALAFGRGQLAANLRSQGRYLESLQLLDDVVLTYQRYPNRIGLWYTLNARSANQESLGQLDRARADAERAYALAKEIKFPLYISESAQRMAVISAAGGDFRRAYEYSKEASDMTAQATREKASARMVELARRYESESQQRQIQELTLRNQQQMADLEKHELRQRWLWTVLAGSVGGFVVTMYLLLRLRRSQNDLQRQTSILRSVLDSMGDGVAVSDPRGKPMLVNPMAEQIVGARLMERNSREWAEHYGLFLPDQTTRCPAADLPLVRAMRGEACDDVELFVADPAQAQGRWLSTTARPWSDKSGALRGAVAVISDVTIRKRAEAALRQREQEFRALVEHSPDVVSRFDAECRRTYSNPALERVLGVSTASLIGLRPSERLTMSADQSGRFEALIKDVLASGNDTSLEISLRTVEGDTAAYQVRLVAERDVAGRVASVLTIGHDVTAMLHTQRQLTTLLENLPDMVARFDRAGRYLYVNPAFTRVSGLSAERVAGRTIRELGLDDQGVVEAAQQRAVREATPNLVEVPWRGPDGERFFEARHVPELDDEGRVVSVLGIAREVTERKHSEQLVRDLGFRREAAREDERKYIARELHDELGQTLSALRLEVSVLRMRYGHDHPGVGERAASMLALVDSVIRVQRDLVSSLRPAVLDMGIGTALEWLVGEFADRSGAQCNLRMAEAELDFDTDQTTTVFRIVQESLTNVARHAAAKRVDIVLERRADSYSLVVQDDGKGFDPAAPRSLKSLGLIGLYERAQMLGGRLDIRSRPNAGVSIHVTFPARARLAVAAGR